MLFDKILRKAKRQDRYYRQQFIPVDCRAISRWYWGVWKASLPKAKKQIELSESNLMPPFAKTFIEFCANEPPTSRWCTFIEVEQISSSQLLDDLLTKTAQEGWIDPPSMLWDNEAHFFVHGLMGQEDAYYEYVWYLDKYGMFLEGFNRHFLDFSGQETFEAWLQHLEFLIRVCLHFFHIKNIRLVDRPPNAKTSRRHRKKYGQELVTYKTLQIKPTRTINENEANPSDDGYVDLRSAHLVRGHFKTYTDDAPLFGKLTGTYWWNAAIRGNPEVGVVNKDYELHSDSAADRGEG